MTSNKTNDFGAWIRRVILWEWETGEVDAPNDGRVSASPLTRAAVNKMTPATPVARPITYMDTMTQGAQE
jgi:hypothetical protein